MKKDGYFTKNLNIAAFLYASGLSLSGTSRESKEVYFEFSPKEKAEKLVENYFANKANVNPKELFARLNDLRDLVFSKSSG
jgi:hypothetical protein